MGCQWISSSGPSLVPGPVDFPLSPTPHPRPRSTKSGLQTSTPTTGPPAGVSPTPRPPRDGGPRRPRRGGPRSGPGAGSGRPRPRRGSRASGPPSSTQSHPDGPGRVVEGRRAGSGTRSPVRPSRPPRPAPRLRAPEGRHVASPVTSPSRGPSPTARSLPVTSPPPEPSKRPPARTSLTRTFASTAVGRAGESRVGSARTGMVKDTARSYGCLRSTDLSLGGLTILRAHQDSTPPSYVRPTARPTADAALRTPAPTTYVPGGCVPGGKVGGVETDEWGPHGWKARHRTSGDPGSGPQTRTSRPRVGHECNCDGSKTTSSLCATPGSSDTSRPSASRRRLPVDPGTGGRGWSEWRRASATTTSVTSTFTTV